MRKNIGFMMAAMALIGASTHAAASTPNFKDVILSKGLSATAGPDLRQLSGSANPYKHSRTPKANQRQKRKLWRQCPHARNKQ